MSLIGTLAKVAAGIAVAKGAQAVLRGGAPNRSSSGPGGGLGDIMEQLGQAQPGSRSGSGGSVIDEIPGQLTGSRTGTPRSEPSGNELGELFEEFIGRKRDPDDGHDALLPGRREIRQNDIGNTESFGEIFNDSLRRGGEPTVQPTRQQEALAALMIRATIQAVKADGRLDDSERSRLLEKLGNVSKAELRFIENEMQRPVDVQGLIDQVPRGLEPQVYAISVTGIDLDQRSEAQYLHELAGGMGLARDQVNAIHDQLGVPRIYG